MSGSLVAALRLADVAQAVLFTTAAPLWAGIVLTVAVQVRVGWMAEFLSKPLVTERAARLFAVNGGYRVETDKEWCGSGSGPYFEGLA